MKSQWHIKLSIQLERKYFGFAEQTKERGNEKLDSQNIVREEAGKGKTQ